MASSIGSTLTVVLPTLFLVSVVNLREARAQFVPICGVAGYNLGNLTASSYLGFMNCIYAPGTSQELALSVRFSFGRIYLIGVLHRTQQYFTYTAAGIMVGGNWTRPMTFCRIWEFHVLNSPDTCLQPSANVTVDSCRFFMAFCRNLDEVTFINCSDASVCQESLPDTASVFKLGGYEQNPFKVDTEYNSQGFIVDFPHGGTYRRINGTACTLSVRLDFICKSDAFWEIPPLETIPAEVPGPIPVYFNESTCQYEIMMNYAGACLYLIPGEVTGLSAGSILVIMFFVCLSAYCIFGAGFKCARGARGTEAIPNNKFWSDLPVCISDGIVFVLQGCRSSKKSYDDI